jgi:C-terminal processing protease CtpA/Prc
MNHGVAELRVMEGNVRYMNLVGFAWTGTKSAAVLDNAMRFLGEGDAVVIDLRYNGGGSPAAIEYLFSHFVAPGKPLMTFYTGGDEKPEHSVSLAKLPAGRVLGKPLYVLTSSRSISAAEAFAALVKDYKVGEIVGETTAGAAYRNSFFPIVGQYLLSVSTGRGEIGPSKLDWEGTGIAPTIKADMASAVEAAHLAALRKLSASASGPEKMMIQAKAAALEAKLSPAKAAHPLQAYSGTYDDRVITMEGDALFGQRAGGPRTRLLPVGGDAFIMESDPSTRVEYAVVDGKATVMEVVRGDGSRQKHQRSN